MKSISNFLFNLIVFNNLIIALSSCLSYRDIVNFNEKNAADKKFDSISLNKEVKLQTDDIVQIFISSYNKEEAFKFNLLSNQQGANQPAAAGSMVTDPFGYRVDNKGNIEMPVVGKIHVASMTLEEMRDEVYRRIAATNYLKEFTVHVRFLSFRVTVLGEVNSPGTYTISSQKVTILEALGMARDVNLFSKRNNILIIREQDGKRTYGRIDLKSKKLFENPWYYLQPNDVVYVQPHRAKILAAPDPASRYISTVIAFVSLVLLILK